MGCSIINMLYNLDLMLLEVFFLYSLKKGKTDIFSMSAHLPSLQVVTELPDSIKGGAKGHVVVRGGWAGLLEHPTRPFSPNYTLQIPGPELRGHLVDWVEKASFACDYVVNILPWKLPKEVVHGEHYTVKELSIYQEAKEAAAEKRRALLEDREKRKNEGTIRKAPGQKRGAPSPPKKTPAKKRKLVKKNGKDVKEPTPPRNFPFRQLPMRRITSLAPVARLANLAEEAASINHPGNANPDADAAEAVCATPTEEAGAESQSQPSDDPDRLALVPVKGPPSKKPRSVSNLRSGLLGRLQDRQQEIESPSVASSGEEPVNDAACSSASSFSYAELEDKLKQIPPGSPDIMPSAKMFETMETLVSDLRGMAQQHDLFADLLRTTDYMKIFASRHKESENQLRLRLEKAEAGLSTGREDNEALRVELAEAKSREESTVSRCMRWRMRQPGLGGR
ncbi:hypothetical protein CK203_061553 [Vitis vinifera]|uniref:Uncharacterized protein n=1 Tax=Vitis vinifera TaxID=29760 RepID=A0A438FQR2_VITVI|nr:hypothetical protein CK203_061553 [Vitis vinifera]